MSENEEIEKVAGTLKSVQPPNPFAGLLHSRKFWMAVLALGNTVVSVYFQVPESIVVSANVVLGIVIAAIAYEDVNG